MGVDRLVDEHGPGGEVDVDIPEGLLHVPQVVVVEMTSPAVMTLAGMFVT